MKRSIGYALFGTGALLLAGTAYQLGRMGAGDAAGTDRGAAASAAAGRTVLYWHDPMVPGQRFDKPGKSPFMDMQLVPVYADAAGSAGSGVQVSAALQQSLGIRTALVRRIDIAASFDALGTVQFDERLNVAVQTRVAGYVERLTVRATMQQVRQGQVLATVFAPEWLGPQNEWLALRRAGASADLVAAARERLRALSIPDALVRSSELAGSAQARYALTAPVSGVVAELGVREGVAVAPGTTLFRIAGLGKVWAVAEVPEAQALRLVRGQAVKAVLQADPSQAFDGKLEEIVPQVSASTRTMQARFEVDNRAGRLVPGLLLRLQVAGPSASRLVVPSEAVIRTGQRAVVLLRREDGSFESREVLLGAESGDDIEVTQGLAEDEVVVASGQFLIDSQARLRSVTGSMAAASAALPAPSSAASASSGGIHIGEGRVESVDGSAITISHGPIASLAWPSMTMGFGKPDPSAYPEVRPGDTVRFEFKPGGPKDYELLSVRRLGASK